MKMGYRILILIDHRSHNITNSLYQLARILFGHTKVREVCVASRSNPWNHAFFNLFQGLEVSGIKVDEQFGFDESGMQFQVKSPIFSLNDFDLILLRLPHPVNRQFFDFLSHNVPAERMINQPEGIIQTGSKKFLLELKEWCPPIQLCTSLEEIITMHQDYNVVLKPLRSYGGKGIFRIYEDRLEGQDGYLGDLKDAEEYLLDLKGDGYLAMQYLENVYLGDKRIVVVNGKIVGAALRKPAPGSWLCNVSQGGQAEAAFADEREMEMASAIHAKIKPLGIGIFGMDTLVDDEGQRVLSEINTLSVGGFGPMEMQHQKPIPSLVANELINFYEDTIR